MFIHQIIRIYQKLSYFLKFLLNKNYRVVFSLCLLAALCKILIQIIGYKNYTGTSGLYPNTPMFHGLQTILILTQINLCLCHDISEFL